MKKEIIQTADGSNTVSIPEMNVTYHSVHGAIKESIHVFIEAGLKYTVARLQPSDSLHIFEMGFGTGLNAFLSAINAVEKETRIHYTTVETSPLFPEEVAVLNYMEVLGHDKLFQQLQQSKWNGETMINEFFSLEKRGLSLLDFTTSQQFHLIYFDAFAPSAQPELWTTEIFQKLFLMVLPGGILVTYCSKGDVRRAMTAAGFKVEKIPGPPGKREMVRAEKRV